MTSPGKSTGPVVLQVLPSLQTGGAERGCIDVAAAIVAHGGTALVASSGGAMTRELPRVGARHIEMPLDTKSPFRIRANVGRLVRLIRAEGVDLIHARSRAPAWSALSASRRCRIPFVTTFHGVYGATNPLKKFYNSVMVRSDQVIAISDYIGRHILQTYAVDAGKVRVVPRGVDLEIFTPEAVSPARVIKLVTDWRLEDGMPVILMPARLSRLKGHVVLMKALVELGRTDIRCLIVGADQGRTAYRRELESQVEKLGLQAVVHLTDHCDDMAAAYKLSDVVVSASVEPEGFGRTVVEAQALGRPVIATNIGATAETIIDGETGWLVPPDNPSALAQALTKALDLNEYQRSAMAQRAIAHVTQNFSRDRMCADTLALYDELLTSRAAETAKAVA